MGYLYRAANQSIGATLMTSDELQRTANLRQGKFKGRIALCADIMYLWPHQSPYMMNVAFSDGHAEGVQLTHYDWEVGGLAPRYAAVSGSTDLYLYFFWRAMETGNFKDFSKKVNALDWTGLRAQYPPI